MICPSRRAPICIASASWPASRSILCPWGRSGSRCLRCEGRPPMKLLLDTDIGSDIDDAVCLAYLLAQPACELLGITTVTGEPVEMGEAGQRPLSCGGARGAHLSRRRGAIADSPAPANGAPGGCTGALAPRDGLSQRGGRRIDAPDNSPASGRGHTPGHRPHDQCGAVLPHGSGICRPAQKGW